MSSNTAAAEYVFNAAISSAVPAGTVLPPAPAPTARPLSTEQLDLMQRYWEASNYLTIGQIYLRENPLLREPLSADHIKPRLLGHWGTSPGSTWSMCTSTG